MTGDALALAELVARGAVAPSELYAACLARLERYDPLLHAVVTVQRERPRPPKGRPFSGVPFLAKDSLSWPGLRWSMGSRMLATNVAESATPFGRRLVDAGLVCAGKTAMSELGLLASTETLLEGVTHNPWDLSRSAGGSSGGSAAAVAAGLVPLAHASDGGGSIRVPASMCGVFGFKPSRGRTVSAWLSSDDFTDMTVDHCVTRSVRDSVAFLAATQELTAEPLPRAPIRPRLRVGAWTRTLVGGEPVPEVRAAFDRTLALLESLGHHVELVDGPTYEEALTDAFYTVAASSVQRLVATIDARRPVQHDEIEPFTASLLERRGSLDDARARFAEASRAHRAVEATFDVTLTPTLASLPPPLGTLSPLLSRDELVLRTTRINAYCPIHNVTGSASMSVPLEMHEHLPVGMCFSAPRGQDVVLLGLALELEAARPWKDRRPRVWAGEAASITGA